MRLGQQGVLRNDLISQLLDRCCFHYTVTPWRPYFFEVVLAHLRCHGILQGEQVDLCEDVQHVLRLTRSTLAATPGVYHHCSSWQTIEHAANHL